ncbi:CHAT domain-containing tetratricopeptide repeat protein, partial [Hyalangium sp.]|uniref:CHAT domain-containing protein n=1 Tax=Hyalangium sp. TaxID=2028555 RepID=UPI002D325639
MVEAQKAFDEGQRLKETGQYAQAIPLVERALALREIVLTRTDPKVVDCLGLLGEIHLLLADYARAEPLLARVLTIREAALGDNHPDIAESLNNLALLYHYQGFYARAESLFARAIKISEATLGDSHSGLATMLNNLAALYQDQGLDTRAEPLYTRALKIREAALGSNHPDVAQSLNNLALLYQYQGLYARAEPLHARALKIRDTALGDNHPDVADSLNNLALLYQDQGLYARAEPLYARASRIWEAALGSNHPRVASSLNNLAAIYYFQGLYARAEPLLVRALKIWETALGDNHPLVASSLNGLATLYTEQGLYARAEPLIARALKIQEAALGNNHPLVASSLNTLATLYKEQGFYARAEPLLTRSLNIRKAALGGNHPRVASSLHNLALLLLAQQQPDKALPLFERAFTSSEQHLRQEVFGLSEQRLATFLHLLRAQEADLYALVRAHPSEPRVRHLALAASLLRKGRSVLEVANTSLIIHRNLGPTDREAFERLRTLRTQLAALSLAGPSKRAPADYQQRLKGLSDEGDALEADLARRSEPLRRLHLLPLPSQLISRVAEALPTDGALIEFIAYQDGPLVHKPGISPAQVHSRLRYLALLLFADGRTRAVDLGLAEPIDRAALRLHDALARQSASYLPTAQVLYKLAFQPLLPHLDKVHRLFLSPDGQLNLIPFAALHDNKRFLVDSFHITYLTSGKDLLPRSQDLPSNPSVVVLADPDFSSPPAAPPTEAQPAPGLAARSASLEYFFSTLRSQGTDIPWTPLPGTRKEADAIHRLFPQAQLLLGPDATKQALLKLSTPGLLHIATHGFFLEDAPSSSTSRAVGNFGAVGAGPEERPADPLLRSGLVLAGIHPPAGS